MAGISKIDYAHTSRESGCTCDRCGQWITNIITVHYTDGDTIHYGIDCFEKLYKDNKLTAYGMKVMKRGYKKIKDWSLKLEDYKTGKLNPDTDISWKYIQEHGGYWQGKPFEEYRDWMINEVIPLRFEEAQKEIQRFNFRVK